MLESAVGAGQRGEVLNVREVCELWFAFVLRLARVPIFCSHPVLKNFLTSKGQV